MLPLVQWQLRCHSAPSGAQMPLQLPQRLGHLGSLSLPPQSHPPVPLWLAGCRHWEGWDEVVSLLSLSYLLPPKVHCRWQCLFHHLVAVVEGRMMGLLLGLSCWGRGVVDFSPSHSVQL